MNFDEAVELALRTWYPKDHELHMNPHHPLGKLLGEWGELLDDYMKSVYKPNYELEPGDELGDIWYYIRILYYQNRLTPRTIDNIVIPELDILINISRGNGDILIKGAMYELDQYILIKELNSAAVTSTALLLAVQYSVLLEFLDRHNLTLDQLTASNWKKLKPGSERGNEWMKARRVK
jgi:hypothetical protein